MTYNTTYSSNELYISNGMIGIDFNWHILIKPKLPAIFDVKSSLVILIWFETVLACIM